MRGLVGSTAYLSASGEYVDEGAWVFGGAG